VTDAISERYDNEDQGIIAKTFNAPEYPSEQISIFSGRIKACAHLFTQTEVLDLARRIDALRKPASWAPQKKLEESIKNKLSQNVLQDPLVCRQLFN
jgi:hypothetical protein